jgi:hypothetical protein
MAELTTDPAATTAPTSSCCSPDAQSSCCEPSDKAECCGETAAESSSCGCAAGQSELLAAQDIRETVRERYAEAARAAAASGSGSCCRLELTTRRRWTRSLSATHSGRFATGVAFITAAPDGKPAGLIVNSRTSV